MINITKNSDRGGNYAYFTKNGKYMLLMLSQKYGYKYDYYVYDVENKSFKDVNIVKKEYDSTIDAISEDGNHVYYTNFYYGTNLNRYIIDINKTEESIGVRSRWGKIEELDSNKLFIYSVNSWGSSAGLYRSNIYLYNINNENSNYQLYESSSKSLNYNCRPKLINNQYLYYSNAENIYKVDINNKEIKKEIISIPIDNIKGKKYYGSHGQNGYFIDNKANVFVRELGLYLEDDVHIRLQVVMFLRNLNAISILSVDLDGNLGDGTSGNPIVSGNGKWIMYTTSAKNIHNSEKQKCVLYNVETEETTILDQQSKDSCYTPSISDDGSKIVMRIGKHIYLYKNNK